MPPPPPAMTSTMQHQSVPGAPPPGAATGTAAPTQQPPAAAPVVEEPAQTFGIREIHPATCVSHAVSIRWTSSAVAGVSGRKKKRGNESVLRAPPDVAVVCGNRLSLYSVRLPGDDERSNSGGTATSSTSTANASSESLDRARLELVCDFSLAGAPTSASTLPARALAGGGSVGFDGGSGGGGVQRDALVLTFREAKAVVLDWDEAHQCPRPSSLHLLSRGGGEEEGVGGGEEKKKKVGAFSSEALSSSSSTTALLPRAHARPPRVASDPEGRCSAVSFFGHKLALLPSMEVDTLDALLGGGFGDDDDEREEENDDDASARLPPSIPAPPPPQRLLSSTVGNAVPLDLRPLGVRDVVDLCFAHRAAAPTLLLLHAADARAWAAAAPARSADGCALLAVAVDDALLSANNNSGIIQRQRQQRLPARLWSVPNLPSDARAVSATPRGGAVVLCHRLLLHVPSFGGGGFGGASSVPIQAIALSAAAVPLPMPPPRLAIDSHVEVPAVTAARHASAWGTRLHPDAAPLVSRSLATGGATTSSSSSSSSNVVVAPPPEGLDADGCGASLTWLSDASALMATADGQLLILRLQQYQQVASLPPSSLSPWPLSLSKAGIASPRASLAALGPGLVFLGSWGGDSLLLRAASEAAERKSVLLLEGGEGGGQGGTKKATAPANAAPAAQESRKKKRRKRGGPSDRLEAERRGLGDDAKGEEDDEIGAGDGGGDTDVGSSDEEVEERDDVDGAVSAVVDDDKPKKKRPFSASSSSSDDAFAFSVLDSLPCTGPFRSAALAEGLGLTTAAAATTRASFASSAFAPDPPLLLAGVGTGRSGALLAMRRSLAAEVITRVPLPGVTGAWALHTGEGGGLGSDAVAAALSSSSLSSSLLSSSSAARRGSVPGAPWGYHDVLLLSVSTGSFGGATRVLKTGDALDEVLDGSSGFETSAPTLAAGALCISPPSSRTSRVPVAAAQVHPRGVSLVVAGTPSRGVSVAELLGGGSGGGGGGGGASQLVAGAVAGRYVAARSASGAAGIAKLVASSGSSSCPCGLSPLRVPRLNDVRSSSPSSAVTAISLFLDGEGWFRGGRVGEGEGERSDVVLLAARAGGTLEVYSLPPDGFESGEKENDAVRLLATYAGVEDGARCLDPKCVSSSSSLSTSTEELVLQQQQQLLHPPVVELLVFHPAPADADGLPDEDGPATCPLLLSRSADGAVRCWRAARRDGGRGPPTTTSTASTPSSLPRFVRTPLAGLDSSPGPLVPGGSNKTPYSVPCPPRLVAFEALGEAAPRHSGVFVCGGGGGGGSGGVASPSPSSSSSSSSTPGWWLVSSRGSLVAHPHHASGPLVSAPPGTASSALPTTATGFTPFHNVNCSRGFLAAIAPAPSPCRAPSPASPSSVHICAMPRSVRLDTPWPSQRAPLRGTPAALAWHAPARLAAVGLSRPAALPRAPLPAQGGGDPAAAYAYSAASAAVTGGATPPGCTPLVNKKKGADDVRLLSAGRWATAWRAPLLPGERATAAASVSLRDGGPGNTSGALVPMVAFGAASACGEDYPSSGRVLLVEVRRTTTTYRQGREEVNKRPGSYLAPLAGDPDWEAEVVYSREFRGPVTAVSAIDGALVVAYGSRVEALAWGRDDDEFGGGDPSRPRKLTRTAFYDAPLFVTSLSVVKNFVLVGDAHKGCRFVHSINGVKNLIELSKDFDASDVSGVGFAVQGRRLGLVSCDRVGAVRVSSYDASHAGSWRGKRLIPLAATRGADYASTVVISQRLTNGVFNGGSGSGGGGSGSGNAPPPRTQAAVLLGVDGAARVVAPMWQSPDSLKRLRALSLACSRSLPQPAGLNPRAWRASWSSVPRALGGGTPWGRPAVAGSGTHPLSPGAAFVDLDQLSRLVGDGTSGGCGGCFCEAARAAKERVALQAARGGVSSLEEALREVKEAVAGVSVW